MTVIAVKVVDNNDTAIKGVTVVAKKDDSIFGEKKFEATTDINGTVQFHGDWWTTYTIEASHSGSYDSGTVRVDANTVNPELLTLQLQFNPTKKIAKVVNKFGQEITANARTLSIGFAVVGSAVVVIHLLNKAKSKSVPTVKIPKINLRK
jgi:hypothetical protein